MKNNLFEIVIFSTCFYALCWYFDYRHIYTLAPQGQHAWRQTDGASQALNYYQFGLNFFKPEVHNVVVDSGQSAAEFPILYYISALMMSLLGAETGVMRAVHLAFYGVGLWYLFKILRGVSSHGQWVMGNGQSVMGNGQSVMGNRQSVMGNGQLEMGNRLWEMGSFVFALGGSLMFFCLPVVVFYAFNFLPNAPALGLIFISWWCFYRFIQEKKSIFLVKTMIWTALAAMIKPTMLISFFVIGGVWLFDLIKNYYNKSFELKDKTSVFNHPLKEVWTFFIVIIPFIAWRIWANAHSHPELFLNKPLPIWEASKGQNDWTWQWLNEFWLHKITFTQPTYFFLILSIILMLIFIKKIPTWITLAWILMLLGVLSEGALFFQQFSVHDYYAIDFLILPAFTLIILGIILKQIVFKLKNNAQILRGQLLSGSVAIVMVLLVISNARYAKSDLEDRYIFKDPYLNGENKALYKTKELRRFIKSLGISPQDTVLSINDPSPNTTLFYLNLKGFTLWNEKVKICADAQSKLPDAACIDYLIKNKNCKYLIISHLDNKGAKPYQSFMKPEKLMGIFDGSVYVYKL